jgi:uncharacterized membrane protein
MDKLSVSEAVLRSLSVVSGGMAIWLVYLLGMKLINRRTAQIGALIFATSPFVIWYSQEARYITLAITTSLLATYAFRWALSANLSVRWLCYSLSLILAIGAFVVNIFLPLIHGLYLVLSKHRAQIKPWLKAQALVFVVVIAWANGGRLLQLRGWVEKALPGNHRQR